MRFGFQTAFIFVGFSNREAIYDVFAFIINVQQQLIVTDILLIRVASDDKISKPTE